MRLVRDEQTPAVHARWQPWPASASSACPVAWPASALHLALSHNPTPPAQTSHALHDLHASRSNAALREAFAVDLYGITAPKCALQQPYNVSALTPAQVGSRWMPPACGIARRL